MSDIPRRTFVAVAAAVLAVLATPQLLFARGGRGGGGRGGGRGGGGRGGGRGGRGGGRGGRGRGGRSPGGRGRGGNTPGRTPKFKDASDYLEWLQREEAEYWREDFQFGCRDDALLTERDRSRREALRRERERAARESRRRKESGSHPY